MKANKAGLDWTVESAGTNSYHTGEPPHPLSQKVAKLNGVDIGQQRARRFEAADFEKFDRIYALANDVMQDIRQIAREKFVADKIDLLMNESDPGKNMDVPDPWYGTEPGYHDAYELIEKACDNIIARYGNKENYALKQTTTNG